jgi:hypothetical protein
MLHKNFILLYYRFSINKRRFRLFFYKKRGTIVFFSGVLVYSALLLTIVPIKLLVLSSSCRAALSS